MEWPIIMLVDDNKESEYSSETLTPPRSCTPVLNNGLIPESGMLE